MTFPLLCFSTKRRAHKPTLTATNAVKRNIRTSTRATSRSHVWLDAAKEAIQQGAEAARIVLSG